MSRQLALRVERLEALLALAFARAAGGGGGAADEPVLGVIYRQGGVAGGNVLTTWAQVKQAIANAHGVLRVYVDSSITTPSLVQTGDVTDCLGNVELWPYNKNAASRDTLVVKDGSTLHRIRGVFGPLTLQLENITTPGLTVGNNDEILVQGDSPLTPAIVEGLGAATLPVIDLHAAAQGIAVQANFAQLESDAVGVPFFALGAVSTAEVSASFVVYEGLVVTGTAGSTLGIQNQDASTLFPPTSALAGFTGTLVQQIAPSAPGTSAYDAPWFAATDIYWDPQAGNDINTGLAAASPVRTFAEIIRRYGSTAPVMPYGQSLTIHKLSAQTAGTDPVEFEPYMSGGGKCAIVDTLVVKSAAFAGGAVTARNQGTNTLLAVAGFPAGTAAGDYVYNQNTNSYAVVVTGGATPTFTTPIPAADVTTIGIPTLAEDNTWAVGGAGQTFIVYTRNLLNLKKFEPKAVDMTGAGNATASAGWVQWSQIPDTSAAAASVFYLRNEAVVTVLSGCQVLSRCHIDSVGGRGFSAYLFGCDVVGSIAAIGTNSMIWGSNLHSLVTYAGGNHNIDGGTVAGAGIVAEAGALVNWGDCYAGAGATLVGAGVLRLGSAQGGATAAYWGTGGINVNATAACVLAALAWNTVILSAGALTLGASGNGTPPPNSGNFVLNGVTQVDVAGVFPANAVVAWSLNTVGGTPGLGSPYFSAAQTANAFHVKSPTALANDTYNWVARDGSVALTPTNLNTYGSLTREAIGAGFYNQT